MFIADKIRRKNKSIDIYNKPSLFKRLFMKESTNEEEIINKEEDNIKEDKDNDNL
jgi:hypothetical protein